MATIQVRVDDKLKAQADALFADIGLDTSSAIRVFLKQSVNRGGIPFELQSSSYLPYLLEADEEARTGVPSMEFDEFEKMARMKIDELKTV